MRNGKNTKKFNTKIKENEQKKDPKINTVQDYSATKLNVQEKSIIFTSGGPR